MNECFRLNQLKNEWIRQLSKDGNWKHPCISSHESMARWRQGGRKDTRGGTVQPKQGNSLQCLGWWRKTMQVIPRYHCWMYATTLLYRLPTTYYRRRQNILTDDQRWALTFFLSNSKKRSSPRLKKNITSGYMDPVDVIGCTSTTTDAIYATGVISQPSGCERR